MKHNNVSFSNTSGTGNQDITVTVESNSSYYPALSTVKATTTGKVEKTLSIWQKGTDKIPLFFNPTTKKPEYINLYAPESKTKLEFASYSPWKAANTEYISTENIAGGLTIVDYFANEPVDFSCVFRYTSSINNYMANRVTLNSPFAIIGNRFDINNAPVIEGSPLIRVTLDTSDVVPYTINDYNKGQTLIIRENSEGIFNTENFNSFYFKPIFNSANSDTNYSKFIVYDKTGKELNIQRVAIQAYTNDTSFYLKIFICDTSDSSFTNQWNSTKEFIKLTVTDTGKVLSEKRTYTKLQLKKELIMKMNGERPFNITPTEETIRAQNLVADGPFYFMSNLPIYYIGIEDDVAPLSMNPNAQRPGKVYDVDIIKEGSEAPVLSLKDIPWYEDMVSVDNMVKLSTPIPPFTLITISIKRQEGFGTQETTSTGSYKKSIGFTATFCSLSSINSQSPINNSASFIRKKCILSWSNMINKPIIPNFPSLEK